MAIGHRRLRATGLLIVALLLGTLFLGQDTNASALAGPMATDLGGSFIGEGFTTLDPGSIVSATIYGELRGHEPATVTAVKLLPLPGTITPTLLHTALLTGLGSGGIHGWPAHNPDFRHQPLIGVPFDPDDTVEILVGFRVHGRGLYATSGLDIDYTVGGRPYHARMYGALTACVHVQCDDDIETGILRNAEQLAGFH